MSSVHAAAKRHPIGIQENITMRPPWLHHRIWPCATLALPQSQKDREGEMLKSTQDFEAVMTEQLEDCQSHFGAAGWWMSASVGGSVWKEVNGTVFCCKQLQTLNIHHLFPTPLCNFAVVSALVS